MSSCNLKAVRESDNDRIMRDEHQIEGVVNEKRIARIRERHDGQNGLQGSLPETADPKIPWRNKTVDFPTGDLTLMGENGTKLAIPYPLLAALIALFVWMAGGTIGAVWGLATISANVSSLNTSMLQLQIRQSEERKQMQDKVDLQQVYITDLREKIVRLEERRREMRD